MIFISYNFHLSVSWSFLQSTNLIEEEQYPRRDRTYNINNSIKKKWKSLILKVRKFKTYFFMIPSWYQKYLHNIKLIGYFLSLWFRIIVYYTSNLRWTLIWKNLMKFIHKYALLDKHFVRISHLFTFTDEI